MSFPQRLLVFCVGVGLGALLSFYILKNRGLQERKPPPETVIEAELEALPGIALHYEERGSPIDSSFIVGEYRKPGPELGTYERVVVLQGRQPGQFLRIQEFQRARPDGTLAIDSWRIMAPSRVVVQLEPGVKAASLKETLSDFGYRLLRPGPDADSYVVELYQNEPDSVDKAIERISAFGPPVRSVRPDYLDRPTNS